MYGSCSTLKRDITLFTSRSPAGRIHNQADLSTESQPDFLWMLSVQLSLSTSPIARVCFFITVKSWWIDGQQSRGELERDRRGKVILPLPFYRSISSWKSPHLLWELLHSSLIVTGKTHFCVHHLAVSLSPYVYMFVYCHKNRENVGSSLQAGCTWALICMSSNVNNRKFINFNTAADSRSISHMCMLF